MEPLITRVIYASEALDDLYQTLLFWSDHNQSDAYSTKLKSAFDDGIDLLMRNPKIGTRHAGSGTRFLLVAHHFKLIYEVSGYELHILRFWDTRQDPGLLGT